MRATAQIVEDAVAAFEAELRASNSATTTLENRCGTPIHAEIIDGPPRAATPAQRERLAVAGDEPIAYRRVHLMCGDVVLSEAENWFVPARLTPTMRAALAGATPFGAIIRPLEPIRRILLVERLGTDPILHLEALVLVRGDKPIAEVRETYRAAALGIS